MNTLIQLKILSWGVPISKAQIFNNAAPFKMRYYPVSSFIRQKINEVDKRLE